MGLVTGSAPEQPALAGLEVPGQQAPAEDTPSTPPATAQDDEGTGSSRCVVVAKVGTADATASQCLMRR